MPLFSSRFSQHKTLPRKSPSLSNLHRDIGPQQNHSEFGIDYGPISIKLGNVESHFEDGKWISDVNDGGTLSKVMKLKKQNVELKEENNLLKLKVDILLDMLAETTAETHIQTKEIEQLKVALTKHRKHIR